MRQESTKKKWQCEKIEQSQGPGHVEIIKKTSWLDVPELARWTGGIGKWIG